MPRNLVTRDMNHRCAGRKSGLCNDTNTGRGTYIMSELLLLGGGDSFRETTCKLIRKTDFFADFSPGDIEYIANWVKAYSAPVGAYIFKEGSASACLCFLVEGNISIFKETTPNEHMKIADITAGGTIGEMGIVDGNPLSASAIAAGDSVVLLMSREDFRDLVHDQCALGVRLLWKIAQIISLRLRQTTGLLAEISVTRAGFLPTTEKPE